MSAAGGDNDVAAGADEALDGAALVAAIGGLAFRVEDLGEGGGGFAFDLFCSIRRNPSLTEVRGDGARPGCFAGAGCKPIKAMRSARALPRLSKRCSSSVRALRPARLSRDGRGARRSTGLRR